MKNKTYFLSTALAAVFGLLLLAAVLIRTFFPLVILPKLDIPGLVLISVVVLLLDHYLAPKAERCYICISLFSAVTFGLLPAAAGFAGGLEAVKLGVIGGVVFTVTTILYTSIQERLSSGPACKLAPALSALGLYLAGQCFAGILL